MCQRQARLGQMQKCLGLRNRAVKLPWQPSCASRSHFIPWNVALGLSQYLSLACSTPWIWQGARIGVSRGRKERRGVLQPDQSRSCWVCAEDLDIQIRCTIQSGDHRVYFSLSACDRSSTSLYRRQDRTCYCWNRTYRRKWDTQDKCWAALDSTDYV